MMKLTAKINRYRKKQNLIRLENRLELRLQRKILFNQGINNNSSIKKKIWENLKKKQKLLQTMKISTK